MLLREFADQDKPRERLEKRGVRALSDVELLSILLGSGNRGRDVLQIAKDLLPVCDTKWREITVKQLTEVKGIGTAKATIVLAALEFARRRIRPGSEPIKGPDQVLPLVFHLRDRPQEQLVVLSLNGAHELIALRVVTIGILNAAHIHPREVFSDPIADRAAAIIIAHNHPSGDCTPSTEDRQVTERIKKAGELLGIKMLDHIIFSNRGHYSFSESSEI